ncbi:MobQ family relaxase [Litoreibacter halocynthiae]|uniref:MobQ family relaxase n=1 Tax=Litoreibacter halocynthiae TaxID=1242689 RepID=UPI0024903BDD|nr:MobQ family relaxase [Litoreibacter halocynthiae]
MASYHLSVKTIKRSAGRTATAAGAYRAGERIECQREGRIHDYTRKQGIEETFIIAPETAPSWAQDRAALWNAAEASETRSNSVTAREWELSLPFEISAEVRSQITREFAEQLVSRYGVAVDVAIHAPNREGDQRNHHAHVLTTTRQLESDGFTAKTRVLDSAKTGGAEIEQMRGVWAELQNRALERAGEAERVDHRSLEKQREAALDKGDEVKAEELDRDPELKLGPAANSMERREKAAAERDGREYVPLTERGAVVHAARQARMAFQEMRERLDLAREVYGAARDEGQGRVSAGLVALRAAASRERGAVASDDIRERLAQITGRDDSDREEPERGVQSGDEPGRPRNAQERLREALDKDRGVELDAGAEDDKKPSIRERLDEVLNKPRERLEIEDEPEKDREVESENEIERDVDRDRGLSH